MPSGEHALIWDTVNRKIVFYGWGKYKPEELQGVVNLRQWNMKRRNYASLGGILFQALSLHKITEEDNKQYHKEIQRQRDRERRLRKKSGKPKFTLPELGTNPETGRPVAEEIGRILLSTNPKTGDTKPKYKILDPASVKESFCANH